MAYRLGGVLLPQGGHGTGALQKAAERKSMIQLIPDIAAIAQEIRLKRKEEFGEGNMVDDSLERRKDGVARRARRTKKSLFGSGGGLLDG